MFSSKRGTSGSTRRTVATFLAQDVHRLAGKGQGREVADLAAPAAGDGDVLADRLGLELASEGAELPGLVEVDAVRAAQRQLHAWGTTGHSSAMARASRRAAGCAKQVSATTSTKSTDSGAARRSAASSGRQPMPTRASAKA